jgi:hypothetical protein
MWCPLPPTYCRQLHCPTRSSPGRSKQRSQRCAPMRDRKSCSKSQGSRGSESGQHRAFISELGRPSAPVLAGHCCVCGFKETVSRPFDERQTWVIVLVQRSVRPGPIKVHSEKSCMDFDPNAGAWLHFLRLRRLAVLKVAFA